MKSLSILIIILFHTIVSGQEYRIEYGNKKFMEYKYICSQDNGFTLNKKLKDGKYIVNNKINPEITLMKLITKSKRNWHLDFL